MAHDKQAGLMILGTHGKVGMQKLTGSHAIKLIHKSPCPVIVVQKRGFSDGYRNIVVPVHNPLEFETKTRWVAYIARMFGATVHLFQIKETDPRLMRDVDEMTAMMCLELDKNTVSWNIQEAAEEGDFADQMEDYAARTRSDLIIIMTNARAEHPEFILGPWEDPMLFNESQIPVMCLTPKPLKTT
jgi:nucleotide-binding universal stress UspA family protein